MEETGSTEIDALRYKCDERELGERAMKIFGMRIAGALAVFFLGLVPVAQPGRLMARATPPATTAAPVPGAATIHGHVNDPVGVPLTRGEVRLTTDKNASATKKFEYTFPIDVSGNYKGSDIKPGNYVAAVYQANMIGRAS